MSSRKARSKPRPRARLSRARKDPKPQTAFCICRGKDDGRPMIHCSHCEDWYHFDCVALNEDDADDIGMIFPLSTLSSFSLFS
jgi:hypothetical protein